MARLSVGIALGSILGSILLGGCVGGDEVSTSEPTPGGPSSDSSSAPTDPGLPVEDGGPLTQLDACDPPPDAGDENDVDGLVLPPTAVITEVQDQGQLIRVDAFVDRTPVEVRMFYGDAEGLEIFEIEDEIFEAEVLFGAENFRSYVKALAICERGSSIIAFVGPGSSGDLPSLGGGG